MTALEVDALVVSIRGRRVIDGVSFGVAPGERVALIGASGSGKSLTAGAVVGQLPTAAHAAGRIRIAGQDVLGIPVARRPQAAGVAAVFQDSLAALNPLVSVGDQLAIPLRHRQGLRGRELADGAGALLRSVGLEDPARILRSWSGELSGGQRQRVCIALALACRTSLLVADEPTTALDVVTQAQVLDVLRTHSEGSALLLITHDLAVAAALCHRVVVLLDGQVVENGLVSDLLEAPRHAHTRQLVQAARGARARTAA